MAPIPTASGRPADWLHAYTRDFSSDEFKRLFTHDTRDAYDFFTRGRNEDAYAGLPWWKRLPLRFRQFMLAFTLRLPPARRALYFCALIVAVLGILKLFRGFALVDVPLGTPFFQVGLLLPVWATGTFTLILGFLLVNLLVILEVADRLSLKGELEVAREIQLAMLPRGTYSAGDIEIFGTTRPANTVGGDFYDVLPLADGKVIVALGDVAGKGSPAALLMALLLAVLRTLVDEQLEPAPLVERLNLQIARHSPASRFITLFFGVYDPAAGGLTYVNAGQNPPLIRRRDGRYERLTATGVALGMFEGSRFAAERTTVLPGEILVLYSDGITEAENPVGQPFEETGLEQVIDAYVSETSAQLAANVLSAVERHAARPRFIDDLTILLLKRRMA
jgi:sigma-B regulation protein RsbU (phosphoserine phosphatase)